MTVSHVVFAKGKIFPLLVSGLVLIYFLDKNNGKIPT
jgi:hypothetical protein